jgi:hypothetical protein
MVPDRLTPIDLTTPMVLFRCKATPKLLTTFSIKATLVIPTEIGSAMPIRFDLLTTV